MVLMEAINIKKYYSHRLIVEFDELKVYEGEKIGIVGPNGCGKTTLMNILSGEIEPDTGLVKHYCKTAYIRQFSDEKPKAGKKLLKEFSLSAKQDHTVFSGGEGTRIKIANALASESLLLFADEPTSNLDMKGIELLRRKLSGINTFLLISHDRTLLETLCNKIIEIRDGRLIIYSGSYSIYKEQVKAEYNRSLQEYEQYLRERESLEKAIADRRERSKSIKKAPSRMGNSEARLHKRRANERREKLEGAVKSIKTRLDKLEVKEKPKETPRIKLDFSLTNPPKSKIVISAGGLTFSYGTQKIFENTGFNIYNGRKTALWGENGSGKTTLLNLIFNNPDNSISIAPKARIGYLRQSFENLEPGKTILENVMRGSVQTETTARIVLARLLIRGDDAHKKVSVLSGGEKIKVSLAQLYVSDANVLLLDEPTNYMDLPSIEALEDVLNEYAGTVLFVSHDRVFVNKVADRLLVIHRFKITEHDGTLDDFEAGEKAKPNGPDHNAGQLALHMKITEIIDKLSRPGADKESLEAEYSLLLKQLKGR